MRIPVVGAGTIGQLGAQTIRENPRTQLVGVTNPIVFPRPCIAAPTGGTMVPLQVEAP